MNSRMTKLKRLRSKKTRMQVSKLMRIVLLWFLIIFYHALIFWYWPLASSLTVYGKPHCDPSMTKQYEQYGCLLFHSSWSLNGLYILVCILFMFTGYQVRYGQPDFRTMSALTEDCSDLSNIFFLVYYNIPFIHEIKVIMDWSLTSTSLDMNQWLTLSNINAEMYDAKCSNEAVYKKKTGERI